MVDETDVVADKIRTYAVIIERQETKQQRPEEDACRLHSPLPRELLPLPA
jgi:hypothetical protein